jgi:endonuclease YncB( thermonuclease family)
MPDIAIRTDSRNNRTTGFALTGLVNGQPSTPSLNVRDGDTINVRLDGNLGLRLLGVDTPEVGLGFPGGQYLPIDDPQWDAFLTDPLNERWGPIVGPMSDQLRAWMKSRTGPGLAAVMRQQALAATEEFRQQLEHDVTEMNVAPSDFQFYMNFGFEVMDGYGRLLCVLNRNQPDNNHPTPRPPSYNLRMLERGRAFPYFIWPNVNPFERPERIDQAVIPPGMARQMAENDSELKRIRAAVQSARKNHLGIFDRMEPLLLEPFEFRNLCRRVPATRYLIDLTSDSDRLIPPADYPSVPMPEDRLWIPTSYMPLFREAGWRV